MSKAAYRRKDVTCVLCQEQETRNLSGVCNECQREREYGAKMLQAAAAAQAGLEFAILPNAPNLYPNRDVEDTGTFQMSELKRRIGKLIYQVAGVTPTNNVPGGWKAYETLPKLKDRDKSFSHSSAAHALRAGTFDALQELILAIQDYAGLAEREGFEKGHNLIGRLAEGSLSLNDLHDAELDRGATGRRRG